MPLIAVLLRKKLRYTCYISHKHRKRERLSTLVTQSEGFRVIWTGLPLLGFLLNETIRSAILKDLWCKGLW